MLFGTLNRKKSNDYFCQSPLIVVITMNVAYNVMIVYIYTSYMSWNRTNSSLLLKGVFTLKQKECPELYSAIVITKYMVNV